MCLIVQTNPIYAKNTTPNAFTCTHHPPSYILWPPPPPTLAWANKRQALLHCILQQYKRNHFVFVHIHSPLHVRSARELTGEHTTRKGAAKTTVKGNFFKFKKKKLACVVSINRDYIIIPHQVESGGPSFQGQYLEHGIECGEDVIEGQGVVVRTLVPGPARAPVGTHVGTRGSTHAVHAGIGAGDVTLQAACGGGERQL